MAVTRWMSPCPPATCPAWSSLSPTYLSSLFPSYSHSTQRISIPAFACLSNSAENICKCKRCSLCAPWIVFSCCKITKVCVYVASASKPVILGGSPFLAFDQENWAIFTAAASFDDSPMTSSPRIKTLPLYQTLLYHCINNFLHLIQSSMC